MEMCVFNFDACAKGVLMLASPRLGRAGCKQVGRGFVSSHYLAN